MNDQRTLWGDLYRVVCSAANRVAREPVLIGAAVLAQFQVRYPHASTAANAAAIAWVALLQRMFSTSKRTAEENADAAKWVGAVEQAAGNQSAAPVGDPSA